MEQGQLSWIANSIWGIANDVLRDRYVRGKALRTEAPRVLYFRGRGEGAGRIRRTGARMASGQE
jgi:hypothetical protein